MLIIQEEMKLPYTCCLMLRNLLVLPNLSLIAETKFDHSINNLKDSKEKSVEYAQTKQVVETFRALGKNTRLSAKDLKDGHYDTSVNEKDMHDLAFIFDGKIYIFQRLPMGSSSPPNVFTEFLHFPN